MWSSTSRPSVKKELTPTPETALGCATPLAADHGLEQDAAGVELVAAQLGHQPRARAPVQPPAHQLVEALVAVPGEVDVLVLGGDLRLPAVEGALLGAGLAAVRLVAMPEGAHVAHVAEDVLRARAPRARWRRGSCSAAGGRSRAASRSCATRAPSSCSRRRSWPSASRTARACRSPSPRSTPPRAGAAAARRSPSRCRAARGACR